MPWSPREDEFLISNSRANGGQMTSREIGQKLERSSKSVEGRIDKLRTDGRILPIDPETQSAYLSRSSSWKEGEIRGLADLKSFGGPLTDKELAESSGKSVESVKHIVIRVQKAGGIDAYCSKFGNGEQMKRTKSKESKSWTFDQDRFLRTNFSRMELADICDQLGKNSVDVRDRADSLGLSKEDNPSPVPISAPTFVPEPEIPKKAVEEVSISHACELLDFGEGSRDMLLEASRKGEVKVIGGTPSEPHFDLDDVIEWNEETKKRTPPKPKMSPSDFLKAGVHHIDPKVLQVPTIEKKVGDLATYLDNLDSGTVYRLISVLNNRDSGIRISGKEEEEKMIREELLPLLRSPQSAEYVKIIQKRIEKEEPKDIKTPAVSPKIADEKPDTKATMQEKILPANEAASSVLKPGYFTKLKSGDMEIQISAEVCESFQTRLSQMFPDGCTIALAMTARDMYIQGLWDATHPVEVVRKVYPSLS